MQVGSKLIIDVNHTHFRIIMIFTGNIAQSPVVTVVASTIPLAIIVIAISVIATAVLVVKVNANNTGVCFTWRV